MAIDKDEWIKAAMADDSVTAELLCDMKHSKYDLEPRLPPPSPSLLMSTAPSWGTRSLRTGLTVESCSAAEVSPTKSTDEEAMVVDSTRYSPTTPFSWNGAASSSATADYGYESRSPTHNAARSKFVYTIDEELPTNSDQPEQMVVSSGALTGATVDNTRPPAADSAAARTESTFTTFLLPDLNMMPPEANQGSCTEILHFWQSCQCRSS